MATNGPKITAEEVAKFNAILKLPAGAEKTKLHQALTPVEKEHLKVYIELMKAKQSLKQHQVALDASQARKQAAEDSVADAKGQLTALESRLEDTQEKLKAMQLQEAALVAKDKAIVVQGSRGFARELAGIKKQQPSPTVNKTVVVATNPKY